MTKRLVMFVDESQPRSEILEFEGDEVEWKGRSDGIFPIGQPGTQYDHLATIDCYYDQHLCRGYIERGSRWHVAD